MAKIDKTVGWLVVKAQTSEHPDAAAFPKTGAARPLVDVVPEASRCEADCLAIEHCVSIHRPPLRSESIVKTRATHLRFVYGIGPRYEQTLQTEGYRTLDDPLAHPRRGSVSGCPSGLLSPRCGSQNEPLSKRSAVRIPATFSAGAATIGGKEART